MQLADGGQGDVPVDETKLHGKPDKTLRFSLCSDNLEGISEGDGLLSVRQYLIGASVHCSWCVLCISATVVNAVIAAHSIGQ